MGIMRLKLLGKLSFDKSRDVQSWTLKNLSQEVVSIRVVGKTVPWYELTLGNKEVRNTETVYYSGVVRKPHRLCVRQVGLRPLDHLTCNM